MAINVEEIIINLKQYALKSGDLINEITKYGNIEFDHISILTKSAEDYEDTVKALSDKVTKIVEIPHDGRRIYVCKLNEPIVVNDKLTIHTLEISEPKPKRVVEESCIDHISFYTPECSALGDTLNENGYKVYDFKTISDTKLFKLKVNDIKLEFRNRRLEDAQISNETKSTDNKDDKNESELEQALQAKLRAIADYQNLKRQVEEEKKYFMVLANASLLKSIIDIMDDFDRAIELHKEGLDDGIKMIKTKLNDLLNEYGVEEMPTKEGERLDPNMHEAVGVVNPDNEEEVNTIKQVVQKGYRFKHNSQVIRPARVIIAKKL